MKVLARLSIGKKLMLGCGVIVAVSLCGSALSLSEAAIIRSDVGRLDRTMSRVLVAYGLRYQSVSIASCMLRLQNPLTSKADYRAQYAILDNLFAQTVSNMEYYPTLGKDGKLTSAEETELYLDCKKKFLAQLTNARKLRAYAEEVEGREDAAPLVWDMFINQLRAPAVRAAADAAGEKLIAFIDELNNESFLSAVDNAEIVVQTSLIVIALVFAGGLAVSLILSRSITRTASGVTQALLSNSATISTSTRELAAGAQSLASGASQQAASVEEISASLEEIASMIKQNADNATLASKLTAAASDTVDATNKAMQRSMAANEEIAKASNETYKIIKTIDEIAFQTNLLSLNAAVEAARAGEVGAGFAVVADEVRGLSMRSAEASKRTAEMIEQTIAKVKEGIEIFNETGKYIDAVVDQTHKIRQLVDEVAAASGEQAKGVDQISRGVSEMDKVIQQNAANSEESAASTEGLRGQVDTMTATVRSFEAFIHGAGHGNGPSDSEALLDEDGDGLPGEARRESAYGVRSAKRARREARKAGARQAI